MTRPTHSAEEIRQAIIVALKEPGAFMYLPTQFEHLKIAVAAVLAAPGEPGQWKVMVRPPDLSQADLLTLQNEFDELRRKGIVADGLPGGHQGWPFFRLTPRGEQALKTGAPFLFHDGGSFERMVGAAAPDIHPRTMLYLREAGRALDAECVLAAAVMVGVATEHSFNLLLDSALSKDPWATTFRTVPNEPTLARKVNRFSNILRAKFSDLPTQVREGMEIQMNAALEVIRTTRNDAGHPTADPPDLEQVRLQMLLFVPMWKKMKQLGEFFRL